MILKTNFNFLNILYCYLPEIDILCKKVLFKKYKRRFLRMNTTKYRKIFDEHDGIIKLSDFTNAGYHNTELYKLMDQGYVEKIKTGYYEWVADEMVSDAVLISKVFPNGVVCLESALYLYNYIDRTPMKWHIAVSKNSSKSKYKIDYPPIEFYFIIDRYLSIIK